VPVLRRTAQGPRQAPGLGERGVGGEGKNQPLRDSRSFTQVPNHTGNTCTLASSPPPSDLPLSNIPLPGAANTMALSNLYTSPRLPAPHPGTVGQPRQAASVEAWEDPVLRNGVDIGDLLRSVPLGTRWTEAGSDRCRLAPDGDLASYRKETPELGPLNLHTLPPALAVDGVAQDGPRLWVYSLAVAADSNRLLYNVAPSLRSIGALPAHPPA
jgi:hypothetical protein